MLHLFEYPALTTQYIGGRGIDFHAQRVGQYRRQECGFSSGQPGGFLAKKVPTGRLYPVNAMTELGTVEIDFQNPLLDRKSVV